MPHPNDDEFRALAAARDQGPFVMLNLLKFVGTIETKDPSPSSALPPSLSPPRSAQDDMEAAVAAPGGAASTGRESYARYADEARKQIERRGGRIIWQGRPRFHLVGGERWDMVALVQYPTAGAFLDMLNDRDYQEAGKHRTAGLADTRLIACEPIAIE